MAINSKYKVYELYRKYVGGVWTPMNQYKAILKELETEDCVYTPPTPDSGYSLQYLTFIAKSSGSFKFSGTTSLNDTNKIQYSLNNGETWSMATTDTIITVSTGDIVKWKGNMTALPLSPGIEGRVGIGRFSGSTASFDVEGNIMSLLYGDNFVGQTDLTNFGKPFISLFAKSKVENASNLILPATTLTSQCYHGMFLDCKSLVKPPILPSTNLESGCYQAMFKGCTNLRIAPQLPATTLAGGCYSQMFYDCTTLERAPDLLAPTLVDSCYSQMFCGCSNLNYIKMLATYVSVSMGLYGWVYKVAPRGTFVKAASMTKLKNGSGGIPNNWSVMDY